VNQEIRLSLSTDLPPPFAAELQALPLVRACNWVRSNGPAVRFVAAVPACRFFFARRHSTWEHERWCSGGERSTSRAAELWRGERGRFEALPPRRPFTAVQAFIRRQGPERCWSQAGQSR